MMVMISVLCMFCSYITSSGHQLVRHVTGDLVQMMQDRMSEDVLMHSFLLTDEKIICAPLPIRRVTFERVGKDKTEIQSFHSGSLALTNRRLLFVSSIEYKGMIWVRWIDITITASEA